MKTLPILALAILAVAASCQRNGDSKKSHGPEEPTSEVRTQPVDRSQPRDQEARAEEPEATPEPTLPEEPDEIGEGDPLDEEPVVPAEPEEDDNLEPDFE